MATRKKQISESRTKDQETQAEVFSFEDRVAMVDGIKKSTLGMTPEQKRRVVLIWSWMANDLDRVLSLNGGAR